MLFGQGIECSSQQQKDDIRPKLAELALQIAPPEKRQLSFDTVRPAREIRVTAPQTQNCAALNQLRDQRMIRGERRDPEKDRIATVETSFRRQRPPLIPPAPRVSKDRGNKSNAHDSKESRVTGN